MTHGGFQLIENIPVPHGLVVEWDHFRFVRPTYYGEKPTLRGMDEIRPRKWTNRIMARGGRTLCRIFEVSSEAGDKPRPDQKFLIGVGIVDCSEDDNYVKSIGRKRSLSVALSEYHAKVGTRERKWQKSEIGDITKGEIGRFTPASPLSLDPLDPVDDPDAGFDDGPGGQQTHYDDTPPMPHGQD